MPSCQAWSSPCQRRLRVLTQATHLSSGTGRRSFGRAIGLPLPVALSACSEACWASRDHAVHLEGSTLAVGVWGRGRGVTG